jgi:hypothetical protein
MKEDLEAKEKELNKRIAIAGLLMIVSIIIWPLLLAYVGEVGLFLSLILLLVGFYIFLKSAIEKLKIKAEKFKDWWKK